VEAPSRFQVGRLYRRKDLHDEYGGQRQQGIITPANQPVIFIVSGSSGLRYGYADEWDKEGVFHYYGEGQVGPMRFKAGNAAIRDHTANEKELHLFEQARRGYLRYTGEMVCSGFGWKAAPDKTGASRQAIVFQLIPADSAADPEAEPLPASANLAELAKAADEDPAEHKDSSVGQRKTYGRSRALRLYVRVRADGVCEGCGQPAPFTARDGSGYLECHHTLRRSDSGPGNRRTVIALCPNCHSRIHFGKDGDTYNEELKLKLEEIETS
jgi:5-methylcytosine-specific restriction enzyme A